MLQLNAIALHKINTSSYGRRIQDYEILNSLGEGGFSTVHKAICQRTNTAVAIKKIRKQVINNEALRDRVTQEINIQSELNHPSILKLYTAFEDDENIYIVLELCSKGELLKYINKNREQLLFIEKEVKGVIRQIVNGLEYLHSKQVLHRDLKLANILLTENMQIKIADFGLATRLMYPDERHITMCGTPNYISPEIVTRKTHGLEADLWSLGCVLYTLLVGKPPFDTKTTWDTFNRVISVDYYMPSFLSESAQDLINRLLQKNPVNRMTLREIRDHPFLLDECSTRNNHKWISTDSGFDTYIGSSNHISSRYHSLDRKHSNNSNDYCVYVDTPKSSRRSRSQDRKWSKESALNLPQNEVAYLIADTIFFPQNDSNRNAFEENTDLLVTESHKAKNNSYTKKLWSNNEFSPIQRCASKNLKHDCEIFCENEILNHVDCNCLQCKCKLERCDNVNMSPLRFDNKYEKKKAHLDIAYSRKSAIMKKTSETKSKSTEKNCGISSESDYAEERVKVVPFNTERLKATRHRLKNIIFSILESGEVCIELLRNKFKDKEMVTEVVLISKTGLKMYIYYPNKGRGIPPSDTPPIFPLSGADAVFNCETLSKENWKKYSYASRFVEMVQSKTPKLTLYTNKAKCVLMENKPEPDFEVIYYDGAKITKSRKGIKLTDNNGVISVLHDTGQERNVKDPHLIEHYKYFQQCYEHCRLIEKQLVSTCVPTSATIFKVFPAILGQKPTSEVKKHEWECQESPNIFHSTKYMA